MTPKGARGRIKAPWEWQPSAQEPKEAPSAVAGWNYGSAVKNAMGTLRDDTVGYNPVSKKQLRKPPRSVV